MSTLGKQEPPAYWTKPSAKAQRLQAMLEKSGLSRVLGVEDALNEAAQDDLVSSNHRLLSVEAPEWLKGFRERWPRWTISGAARWHS